MAELRVTVRSPSGLETGRTIVLEVAPAGVRPAGPDATGRGAARRIRLGQILIEAGVITQVQLRHALDQQETSGERLGQIVRRMGLGSQESIGRALAQQLGIEFARLDATPEETVLLQVPEALARRHEVIPLRVEGRILVLGMVDPLDVIAADDVRRVTGLEVRPAVITADDFQQTLGQYPTIEGSVQALIEEIAPAEAPGEEVTPDRLQAVASEAPIVRLVNMVVLQAVRQGASDIHIEPQDRHVRVRFRVDGRLASVMTPPRHVHAALVSRIKIMANMNIAERRIPQDGRIDLKIDHHDISFRVSTTPTVYGEKVVMRILDRRSALVELDRLGLEPRDAQQIRSLIARPHGIILVTGPTGSGKTTTLYAVLNRLNRPEVNILTIEDPVEYQLPGIAQVPVNPRAGVTFATGLRAFLRQDPDIIMVGEIRDEETARIAIHAALTGHVVLSTLHTNDAPSAITRLVDMGIEPFLVASSLIGVVAQRLVRVLCERCRRPYQPSEAITRSLGLEVADGPPTFYRPAGCQVCNHTGHRGRVGLFEILDVDQEIKQLVVRHTTDREIREVARAKGLRTLQEAGVSRILSGTTSLEEVLRTVFVEDGAAARRPAPEAGPDPDGGRAVPEEIAVAALPGE